MLSSIFRQFYVFWILYVLVYIGWIVYMAWDTFRNNKRNNRKKENLK